MRTGYHYTSFENWKKIKKEGFVPYQIVKKELTDILFNDYPKGIWLWKRKLSKEAQTGVILSQIASKNSRKIVLLKVKYNEEDILTDPKNELINILLCHSGTMGNFRWESGKAVVITNAIRPINIELMKCFQWQNAWRD